MAVLKYVRAPGEANLPNLLHWKCKRTFCWSHCHKETQFFHLPQYWKNNLTCRDIRRLFDLPNYLICTLAAKSGQEESGQKARDLFSLTAFLFHSIREIFENYSRNTWEVFEQYLRKQIFDKYLKSIWAIFEKYLKSIQNNQKSSHRSGFILPH